MMKRINLILLICSLLLSVTFANVTESEADHQTLKVGVFEIAPLVSRDESGKLTGALIEVFESIAEAEGWDFQYVPGSFPEGMRRLELGELDLMMPIAYTAERARKISFIHNTIFMDWSQIYVPTDSDVKDILDLEGKRVASLKNSLPVQRFIELVDSFGITVELVYLDDYLDVFKTVQRGEADALIVNRMFGEKHLSEYPVQKTAIIFSPIDIRFATPLNLHPDVRQALDRRLAALIADHQSVYYQAIERMYGGADHAQGGVPRWLFWAATGGVTLLGLFILLSVVLRHQVQQRTADLHASEERYRATVEHAAVGIVNVACDGLVIRVNPFFSDMLGYTVDELIATPLRDLMHPDDRGHCAAVIERMMNGLQSAGFMELRYLRKTGETLWTNVSTTLLRSQSGDPLYFITIVSDITKRKLAEQELDRNREFLAESLQEKNILLKEIHHRVKNNMQVISSLLQLQVRYIKDTAAQEPFIESQNRIRSMALVHELLYQSSDIARVEVGSYVRDLLRNLFSSYTVDSMRIELKTDIDPLTLEPDMLIPLGLIINELVMNSLKHAFTDRDHGVVSVRLHVLQSSQLRLEVSDDGKGGVIDFEHARTLGLLLVNSLVNQLEGVLHLDQSAGVKFTITFAQNDK